jgi:putative Holliday junction resolvase
MYYNRIMGLDVGDKRIGIAMSDPLRITAQGIETYTRAEENADINYIAKLAKENDVEYIVCGFPKNMNGTIGPQAEKVKAFASRLTDEKDLKVILEDERLTSVLVEKVMIEADVSRQKRRKSIDKLAAVTILQNHLDGLNYKS